MNRFGISSKFQLKFTLLYWFVFLQTYAYGVEAVVQRVIMASQPRGRNILLFTEKAFILSFSVKQLLFYFEDKLRHGCDFVFQKDKNLFEISKRMRNSRLTLFQFQLSFRKRFASTALKEIWYDGFWIHDEYYQNSLEKELFAISDKLKLKPISWRMIFCCCRLNNFFRLLRVQEPRLLVKCFVWQEVLLFML